MSFIQGVDMSNIKKINTVTVDVHAATLLTEIDFTALAPADWTGESTVSLDGKAWDIQNGGNANAFGPDGSTLVLHPKGTAVGDWYNTNRSTPSIAIDLSDLDSSLTDSCRYAVQIITPGFQSPGGNYARLLFGFYNPASTNKGYGPVFGLYHNGGNDAIYWIQGSNDEAADSSVGFTGSEQTFWVYLESNGLWTTYTSDSQDTTVDGGTKVGTVWASISSPSQIGRGADLTTGLLTKPSTARVVLTSVGYNATTTGPTMNIDSLRVWKLSND
tara:strand:+ start:54 stop:872 length:819 start_codon:yes stop_codon:yes gene_type:complete